MASRSSTARSRRSSGSKTTFARCAKDSSAVLASRTSTTSRSATSSSVIARSPSRAHSIPPRRRNAAMPSDQGRGAHRRADRVAEAIREEVATFLAEEVKDPRITGLVTVTGVDVTRDLRHAKVHVSILGTEVEKKATMEGLASVAGHLRAKLGRTLRLRVTPELDFRYDDSIAHAARIDSLLEQIRADELGKDADRET